MRRATFASALLVLAVAACAGPGARVRAQIRPGMSTGEVLATASGWQFCSGYPNPRPDPEALVRVSLQALAVRGFGEGEATLHYASRDETALALASFMRRHPGSWTLTFGYVAVPRREYFDVSFDDKARVLAVSEIRYGGPS